MLKLKELQITRGYFGDQPLICSATFTDVNNGNQKSEIKIQLTEEQTKGVLVVIADSIVAASKNVAENLVAAVIEQAVPAIEAPKQD